MFARIWSSDVDVVLHSVAYLVVHGLSQGPDHIQCCSGRLSGHATVWTVEEGTGGSSLWFECRNMRSSQAQVWEILASAEFCLLSLPDTPPM